MISVCLKWLLIVRTSKCCDGGVWSLLQKRKLHQFLHITLVLPCLFFLDFNLKYVGLLPIIVLSNMLTYRWTPLYTYWIICAFGLYVYISWMNLCVLKYTFKNATLDMLARKCCHSSCVSSLIKRFQSLINYFLLDFNPFDIFCHHKVEFGNQEFVAIHICM